MIIGVRVHDRVEHVLAWRYEKDMNVEIGDDFVIIDAISADGVAP